MLSKGQLLRRPWLRLFGLRVKAITIISINKKPNKKLHDHKKKGKGQGKRLDKRAGRGTGGGVGEGEWGE